MNILTLNCGSSSVKYQLYTWEERKIIARGIVERIGIDGSFLVHDTEKSDAVKTPVKAKDHLEAISHITKALLDPDVGVLKSLDEIQAVGHRVVHGGEKFTHSVIIDDNAMATFRELSGLAPLHNPPNITGIEAAKAVLPRVPHCAIMDTAWHQTMQPSAYIYALPYEWYTNYGVRRYGFHGTSFLYVSKRAAVLLGKDPFEVNLICLHLGNGASIDAVANGVSVDTSLGFTPLEGLVMGTRSGDHDPAIGFYIMKKTNALPADVEKILNKGSGLLGITGTMSDRRDILEKAAAGDARAQLAVDIESYRMKKYIGAYAAALGRVDAIVFTAGAGEMSAVHRSKALSGLQQFGIVIDEKKNALSMTRNAETDITGKGSKVKVFVIPTDEELVMTEDTRALLQGTYKIHTEFTYSFQKKDYVNPERADAFEKEVKEKPELKTIVAQIG